MNIEWVVIVAVAGLWLATLLCWAARHWWLAELATHFRPHYVLAAAVLSPLAVLGGHWILVLLAGTAGLPHLYELWRAAREPAEARAGDGRRLVVATFNLAYPNHNAATVDHYLATLEPDILCLQEAGDDWPGPASGNRLALSGQANKTTGDYVTLLSCFPVRRWRELRSAATGVPLVIAELLVFGRSVTVVNYHSASPKTGAKARNRNLQFGELAQLMATIDGPKILAGDFNCSPWSPFYQDLVAGLGMVNVAQGRANFCSWPTMLSFLGIPIDHILISPHFRVERLVRGPGLGSDHRPVIAELELTTPVTLA